MSDSKPTTREERKEWETTDWCPDEEPCYDEEGKPTGIDDITLCTNEVIARLIKDVDRAHEALRQGIRVCRVFEGALAAGNKSLAGAQWRDFANLARALLEEE